MVGGLHSPTSMIHGKQGFFNMTLFIYTDKPLSHDEIVNQLRKLRDHSDASFSHYHVAALVEFKLGENSYAYSSGVNVENIGHNRLSLHAEQNAVVSGLTMLGGDTKFSKLWVMAAHVNDTPNESQIAGKACGHCRQILMSLAAEGAEVRSVTLDGRMGPSDTFDKLLPDGFCEQQFKLPPVVPVTDVSISSTEKKLETEYLLENSKTFTKGIMWRFLQESKDAPIPDTSNSDQAKIKNWNLLNHSGDLTQDDMAAYLRTLTAHIINKEFQTSPITACILKCNNGRYAAGVLAQDIAFLTTDTILAAIGNAVTQFGAKNLYFDEIHLQSNSLDPAQLTLTEIEALAYNFSRKDTRVHFHTNTGKHATYGLHECQAARNKLIEQHMANNYAIGSIKPTKHAINYSFFFKCLAGITVAAGATMLILGMFLLQPVVAAIGLGLLATGAVTGVGLVLNSLFAKKPAVPEENSPAVRNVVP